MRSVLPSQVTLWLPMVAMRVKELAQKTAGHYAELDQSKGRSRPGAKAAAV